VPHVFEKKCQTSLDCRYGPGKRAARGAAENAQLIESERSGGNLFEDTGVPDAENMKVRAELIVEIRSLMSSRQGRAA